MYLPMITVYVLISSLPAVFAQNCTAVKREFTSDFTWQEFSSEGYNGGTGSYISDMSCWWRVDAGSDDLKVLMFLTYDTACPNDRIIIHDGINDSGNVLGSVCGFSTTPKHYSTTQRFAYISMVTDSSVQKPGFTIEFLSAKDYSGSGCINTEYLTASESLQFLSSPNFPGLYLSSKECRWVISSSSGMVDVAIIVSDIEDDSSNQCTYDKYRINDGNDRCDNNEIKTVCSQYPKVTPFSFTSSGKSVVVSFSSDSSVERRGFFLSYRSNLTTETTTSGFNSQPSQECASVSQQCEHLRVVVGVAFGLLFLVIITSVLIFVFIRHSIVSETKCIKSKVDIVKGSNS